jgi:hypothetical protein
MSRPEIKPMATVKSRVGHPGGAARRWLMPLAALMLAALAACNGSAVVTLTSTPSTDTFLAYRVKLVSIRLETGSGRNNSSVLPNETTVDLAQLSNLAEVVGAAGVNTGNFSRAVVTLDYGSAQIIYDDGTPEGLTLTPLGANGQALGQVAMTLYLDPSNQLGITHGSAGRLSLGFNLAASNAVNVAQKTVTVTPLMAASALPIDSKVVRIRGPLGGVNTSRTFFSSGIQPFDFGVAGAGSLRITPTDTTTYEINGKPSTGSTGFTELAALRQGAMVESYGTLTSSTSTSGSSIGTTNTGTTNTGTTYTCSDGTTPQTVNGLLTCLDGSTLITQANNTGTSDTCSDGTTPQTVNGVLTCTDGSILETTGNQGSTTGTVTTSVSFSATQVLAGSSVQGSGFDRVTGVVTGRSGDTLTIDDGTLLSNDGTNSLIAGTTTVKIGSNTQVTQFGAGSAESNGSQQISVGSLIDAFGTASAVGSNSATLDASAGRARLEQSTASGLVTVQGTTGGTLTLSLATLGGRSIAAFDFLGTGSSASASPTAYAVATGNLTLTYATDGEPVEAIGYVTAFGRAPPDFSAQTLLDYTTINAELVMDWSGGTQAPFASYNTSEIVLDAHNSAIGTRHEIQVGAQAVALLGIATNPAIVPNANGNAVFTIGHSSSGTFENFNTFSAFVTQLQTELTGNALATGITATGFYTANTYNFSASSITLFLDD